MKSVELYFDRCCFRQFLFPQYHYHPMCESKHSNQSNLCQPHDNNQPEAKLIKSLCVMTNIGQLRDPESFGIYGQFAACSAKFNFEEQEQ